MPVRTHEMDSDEEDIRGVRTPMLGSEHTREAAVTTIINWASGIPNHPAISLLGIRPNHMKLLIFDHF